MKSDHYYTIGEIAKILDVSPRTLKNYEKQGKIPEPMRNASNNWRIYTEEDIEKLKALFFTKSRER
ncbi:MAG: MerR family transcriptional regulator [Candidatus Aerophobetes bacterium]|nr:MerR family transcriptional regulator [Candidatus Aerophobetes bacterium]